MLLKDESMYTLYSESHSEEGQITDIHLSEQYTNGSFVVDVKEVWERLKYDNRLMDYKNWFYNKLD